MLSEIPPEEREKRAVEVYARITMEATVVSRDKTFVLVEGPSDRTIYRRIIDDTNHCIILTEPDWGRELIQAAFPIIDSYRGRTLGIIDQDFDYVLPEIVYAEGLIVTPTHDLETLILSTPAFENLLRKSADEKERAEIEEVLGKSLITLILGAARPLGLLRTYDFLRRRQGLSGMNFQGLPYGDYLDLDRFSFDLHGVIDWVRANTADSGVYQLATREIRAEIDRLDQQFGDDWVVCQGHDLEALLILGLNERFGSGRRDIEYSSADLKRWWNEPGILKPEYLLQTELCSALREWEEAHNPYKILRLC